MSNTIEFELSKMTVKFRVVDRLGKMLFSSDSYIEAEKFCWRYDGLSELEIKKIFISKEIGNHNEASV